MNLFEIAKKIDAWLRTERFAKIGFGTTTTRKAPVVRRSMREITQFSPEKYLFVLNLL